LPTGGIKEELTEALISKSLNKNTLAPYHAPGHHQDLLTQNFANQLSNHWSDY